MGHNHSLLIFQFTEYLKTMARTAATVKAYSYNVGLYLEGVTKDIKAVTRGDLEDRKSVV